MDWLPLIQSGVLQPSAKYERQKNAGLATSKITNGLIHPVIAPKSSLLLQQFKESKLLQGMHSHKVHQSYRVRKMKKNPNASTGKLPTAKQIPQTLKALTQLDKLPRQ